MNSRWHFRALLIWLLLLAGVYLLFDKALAPKVAAVSTAGSGEVVIPQSRDGHYYLAGSINGKPITFMIDTGASSVAVSREFARSAGLPAGYPTTFSTANGTHQGEIVAHQTVEAGGISVSNIAIGVGLDMGRPDQGLLGQSFLNHVAVSQADGRMTLKPTAN